MGAFFKTSQIRTDGGSNKYKVGEVFVESFTNRHKNDLRGPFQMFSNQRMVVAAANRRIPSSHHDQVSVLFAKFQKFYRVSPKKVSKRYEN